MDYSKLHSYSTKELKLEFEAICQAADVCIKAKALGQRFDIDAAGIIIKRERLYSELQSREMHYSFNNTFSYELN